MSDEFEAPDLVDVLKVDHGASKRRESAHLIGVPRQEAHFHIDGANVLVRRLGVVVDAICQRSANVVSMGPMLQGLAKPVNDLSRGCLVEDIVFTINLTAIQAQQSARRKAERG